MPSKILFVDDEPDLEWLISQKLKKKIRSQELQVVFSSNGAEALSKLRLEPDIDLVVTDINMPVMDGLSLLVQLNDQYPLVKTVIMSAYNDLTTIRKAMNYGAFDFLTKPLDFQDLEITINKTLNHVQQLKESLRSHQKQDEELRRSEARAREQATQLEQALQTLQRTQAQLIQTEKMSSLGQLVAGVAHEINNPVNFIYGNLEYAGDSIQQLIDLIALYQQNHPYPSPEIQHRLAKIDLEFLVEDLPKLLSSMKVGAERIRQLVLTLRNFSRVDESEMKRVNIHEGIDSTLVILQNRLKGRSEYPVIEVIKEYSDLPLVECYAGQLNQVFINLLSNAIDALEASWRYQVVGITQPTIQIRTERIDSDWVRISIQDNGMGMTDNIKARIFDPFFTTKGVGEGTGLGLSISYQIIVEKHNGQLKCFSQLGQGAEFQIEIPLKQSSRKLERKAS